MVHACNVQAILFSREWDSSFSFNFLPYLQQIENEGRIGFFPVLLINSDQLYLSTFN